jgi:hypothetical protein
MGMTRFSILLVAVLAVGCNKPSKEDCRTAIENMRTLMRTQNLQTDVEGEVRRCNGGSTKEAVACAIKATTVEELGTCKFMSIPDSSGSATGSAGSGSAAGSAN